MRTLSEQQVATAIATMRVLQICLSDELSQIEACLHELDSDRPASRDTPQEHDAYVKARAALHSGMASITDVLGWVRLLAEKDSQGNEQDAVRVLPTVPVLSIN